MTDAKMKRPALGKPGASGNADQLDAISFPNNTAPRHKQDKAKFVGAIQRSAAARNPRRKISVPKIGWLDRVRP